MLCEVPHSTFFLIHRTSVPSTFLTASALSAIYKVYSYNSNNGHRGLDNDELPLTVDARVIERCLHWLFIHQVKFQIYFFKSVLLF